MVARHSPTQQLKEAFQTAKDHGMHIREKGGQYQVFRIVNQRPVFMGHRGSPQTLRAFVMKLAA